MARRDGKLDLLGSLPLFAGLNRQHLEQVSALCTQATIAPGKLLCTEGTSGREFFVIVSGTATVSIAGSRVGSMGAGDFFGEISLVSLEPRTATVTADDEMSVLVLSIPEFRGLLNSEPQIADVVLRAVEVRGAGTLPTQRTAQESTDRVG